ncbi:HNH/ENDO VII family nuclease [Pseudomonas quasicaspiana]|uniref:HNH/ENDO VII family nuclease n=1 Tax=Pseudomonas quasicaspiana TaxID=2829821 RepID=UPI003872ACAA
MHYAFLECTLFLARCLPINFSGVHTGRGITTNLDLMKNGNALIGLDVKYINLHHVTGDKPGPMVELTGSTHKNTTKNYMEPLKTAIVSETPRNSSYNIPSSDQLIGKNESKTLSEKKVYRYE